MAINKLFRLIFIRETVVLVFALVSLWFTISLWVDERYAVKDLVPHKGVVIRMDSVITRVKDKPLLKEITKQLRIALDTEQKSYTSSTTTHFGNIVSKLSIGDTAVVFTKPKYLGIFGLRPLNEINQLESHGEKLVNFEDYRSKIAGMMYFTLLCAVFLLILYIVRLRKRLWWEFDGYTKHLHSDG